MLMSMLVLFDLAHFLISYLFEGRVDSEETNQAAAGDAITSRSRDKLKTFLH